MPNTKIRTRFAPSPTGLLHIGNLRSALYAYALAKHSKGDFILRIEDTDQKREVAGVTQLLQNTLKKFGLNWDEYYVQSERQKAGIYQKAAEKLLAAGHAFYCNCEGRNSQKDGYSTVLRDPCRDKKLSSGAIKLKVPGGKIVSYVDFVHRKEISWNTDTVYDATLLKTDGFPTYHLAAMVDDLDMQISHILRGHDWLPSTPIHLLVLEYLGGVRPEIGHLTDILSATTGKKLSKRRDSVFCEQFLEMGYLPEALLNFIMLLGWAPKDNRELYTLEEFVASFDPKGFQEANPRFLDDKLKWFNGHYLRLLPDNDLLQLIKEQYPAVSEDLLLKIIPLAKERIRLVSDFDALCSFFFSPPGKLTLSADDQKYLSLAKDILSSVTMEKTTIESSLVSAVTKNGWKNGPFFAALRLAITGKPVSPPLTESMIILGKEEVLKRLDTQLL